MERWLANLRDAQAREEFKKTYRKYAEPEDFWTSKEMEDAGLL